MVDPALEFRRLNQEQRDAVLHEQHTVVLAGPGSGKTATLVLKIWHELQSPQQGPRGLACVTYNNDCVREIRERLSDLGVRGGRRLFLGTVHSFCLNAVLRPYGHLALGDLQQDLRVASPTEADTILRQVLAKVRPQEDPRWYGSTFTRLRRRLACHEDVSGFHEDDLDVHEEYVSRLKGAGLVDFELMVGLALQIVEEQHWVREMIAARFRWLMIDEYQDLGGPLDRIATTLAERTSIKLFVVGDPDQTVYDFTGADPKYLARLAEREDFCSVRLRFNYRSGRRLISAAEAALAPGQPRGYEPDPERADPGEIYFYQADTECESHADLCSKEIVPKLQAAGVPLEQIAILYKQKGPLLSAIVSSLVRDGIQFIAERDGKYPTSRLVRWLQECASWLISASSSKPVDFETLVHPLHELIVTAGLAHEDRASLATRSLLFHVLSDSSDLEIHLAEWLNRLDEQLNLRETLRAALGYADELEAIDSLLESTKPGGRLSAHRLIDFANDGRLDGKVVVTTLHSSKGRQFDVVILPGLVEGLMPPRPWNGRTRRYDEPAGPVLGENRRLFYVGFSRARKMVFLVHSEGFRNRWGYPVELGRSRFVREIEARLAEEAR